MLGLRIAKRSAQEVKRSLLEQDALDRGHIPVREADSIVFPLKKKVADLRGTVVDQDFPVAEQKTASLKEAVQDKLTDEEKAALKTAFDQVGDIAILEIDDELSPKEQLIAETLLSTNKQIRVVCKKAGIHEGPFRTQKMRVLAGEQRMETVHKENGVRLRLNVQEVYFSARLSTERKRITQQVKQGERILVMFSGCGVYALNLAKNTHAKEIIGIELNPAGHRYALFNKELNHAGNVVFINADVNNATPLLEGTFDRILMPLPKSAADYLDVALQKAKKGTIIHFYDFLAEGDFGIAHRKIDEACKRNNKICEILDTVRCGQHAPRVFRICVDFRIYS